MQLPHRLGRELGSISLVFRARPKFVAVLLVVGLALNLLAGPADAAANYVEGTDAAATLYDPLKVREVALTMPQSSIDSLFADPRTYVPGTFTITVDGTQYGPLTVGIRLKG